MKQTLYICAIVRVNVDYLFTYTPLASKMLPYTGEMSLQPSPGFTEWLKLVVEKPENLRNVPESRPDYFEIALAAVRSGGYALFWVPSGLPNYDKIALAAVRQNPFVISYVDYKRESYGDLALRAISLNGHALQNVSTKFADYHHIAMEAIKRDPHNLQHVPHDYKNRKSLEDAAEHNLATASITRQ